MEITHTDRAGNSLVVAGDRSFVSWATSTDASPTLIKLADVAKLERISADGGLKATRILLKDSSMIFDLPAEHDHIDLHYYLEHALCDFRFIAEHSASSLYFEYQRTEQQTGNNPDQPSALLKLPGELRNAIYDYVADQVGYFAFFNGRAMPTRKGTTGIHALAHASQQIRLEFLSYLEKNRLPAAPLVFEVSDFDFDSTISVLKTVPSVAERLIIISLHIPPTPSEFNLEGLRRWLAFLLHGGSHDQHEVINGLSVNIVYDTYECDCHEENDHGLGGVTGSCIFAAANQAFWDDMDNECDQALLVGFGMVSLMNRKHDEHVAKVPKPLRAYKTGCGTRFAIWSRWPDPSQRRRLHQGLLNIQPRRAFGKPRNRKPRYSAAKYDHREHAQTLSNAFEVGSRHFTFEVNVGSKNVVPMEGASIGGTGNLNYIPTTPAYTPTTPDHTPTTPYYNTNPPLFDPTTPGHVPRYMPTATGYGIAQQPEAKYEHHGNVQSRDDNNDAESARHAFEASADLRNTESTEGVSNDGATSAVAAAEDAPEDMPEDAPGSVPESAPENEPADELKVEPEDTPAAAGAVMWRAC